jgi:hypothetical protein
VYASGGQCALEYDQDIRIDRPERAGQEQSEQADVPQAAAGRERHAADQQGVLYSRESSSIPFAYKATPLIPLLFVSLTLTLRCSPAALHLDFYGQCPHTSELGHRVSTHMHDRMCVDPT